MAKKIFLSFHYKDDNWRVQTIKNIGSIEEQPLLSSNDWEEVKRGGKEAVEKWINEQMKYKSCVVVLIGSNTAGRKWIGYEITHGWNSGKGLVGVYIHNLKDSNGNKSTKGSNPFSGFNVDGTAMTSIVKAYDPPYTDSQQVYDHIKNNIEAWVDEAVTIRGNY